MTLAWLVKIANVQLWLCTGLSSIRMLLPSKSQWLCRIRADDEAVLMGEKFFVPFAVNS